MATWAFAVGAGGGTRTLTSCWRNVAASGTPITVQHDRARLPRVLGGGSWAEVKRALRLDPDWAARPPKLLWKQPIGAGWSGFAIVGDYAFTQEQRGRN